jgi:hypothetical protein
MGWKARVRFPSRRDFSLSHNVETGSEAHPPFYSMGTGIDCQEVKRPELEADHSISSVAEVENDGAVLPLP